MQRGDFDFNVISEEDIRYFLQHADEYADDSRPFGEGQFKVVKTIIGVKEQLILSYIVKNRSRYSDKTTVMLTGNKAALLFLYIYKNTIVRGAVDVGLIGKKQTLHWVVIGNLLIFDNGLCIIAKSDSLASGYPGGVTSSISRDMVNPMVNVPLISTTSELKDVLENNSKTISTITARVPRGVLLYALFNTDLDSKPPCVLFGLTDKYSTGTTESDACFDYANYYGEKTTTVIGALDGYIGTVLNKDNNRIVSTNITCSKYIDTLFSILLDSGLIDVNEKFDGLKGENYLSVLDEEVK